MGSTLLLIGLAALAVAMICKGILVVAASRAQKSITLVYTREFQMPYKALVLAVFVGSVLVGFGAVVSSAIVGPDRAAAAPAP